MTERPLWLQSSEVQELLNRLLDRLDSAQKRVEKQGRGGSARPQSLLLDESTWPALYDAPRESIKEDLWDHVREMVRWGWLKAAPVSSADSPSGYAASPRLTIVDETALRSATARPERVKSAAERWRAAVYSHLDATDAVKDAVAGFCIDIPGRPMPEVVERLNRLRGLARQPLLLREVSSRLFWGQSKLLDNRQVLVAALLGLEQCPFPESPVQLQVSLSAAPDRGVLFIENLGSFERATRSRSPPFDSLTLVYASGFKGSAQRLRTAEGCSVFYCARGALGEAARAGFEAWLFGGSAAPAFFWGDLDWSGMRILSALQQSFAQLQAWQPGYQPMLEDLLAGGGHTPAAADKGGQLPLDSTDCVYANMHLLPALKQYGRFIDQEWFSP